MNEAAPNGSTVTLQAGAGLTGAAPLNVVVAPIETSFDVAMDIVSGNGIDTRPLRPGYTH